MHAVHENCCVKKDVSSTYAACTGVQKNGITVFSAHQMGTARMGADPKKSCVDPQGENWEVCTIIWNCWRG